MITDGIDSNDDFIHFFLLLHFQLSLTDEQFPVDEELRRGCVRTPVTELVSEARSIAQVNSNHYPFKTLLYALLKSVCCIVADVVPVL